MTDTALRTDDITTTVAIPEVAFRPPPLPVEPRPRFAVADLTFAARIGIAVVLAGIGYFSMYAQVVADALAGSRAALLVVTPVLLVLIVTGYRAPVRGVEDTESDWIVAALVGIGCFAGIHLLSARMPALATLWGLPFLGFIVWFACVLAILLGVRQVLAMWKLWVFTVCCATPLPFLLATAALGGSDDVAAVLAAAVGAVAVYLASKSSPARNRLLAAAGCFGVAAATVTLLGAHAPLLTKVVVGAGVLPVLAVFLLYRATRSRRPLPPMRLPHCSLRSLTVLALIAVALGVLTYPGPRPAEVPPAPGDWAARAGLGAPTAYPFATRFLGADVTLVRYDIPGAAGQPAAAVDVMSSPSQAVLDDFAGAVWYPSTRPVEYRPAPSDGLPATARIVHSNADAATYGDDQHWYAVTWRWHTGSSYQDVTVIVSQAVDGRDAPPAPKPVSLLETSIEPVLWIARQQPHAHGQVDPLVTGRADDLARRIGVSSDDSRTSDDG